MSLRWKTTRSSARSIVSVAVAAPSARFAALNLAKGSRYVRGTRCFRVGRRFRPVGVGMSQCIDDDNNLSIHRATNGGGDSSPQINIHVNGATLKGSRDTSRTER